jgi:hypothetical protein
MIDFDVSELIHLEAVLGRAGPRAEQMTKTVVAKTGFDTVAGAQALAPVDTGNLKSSIGVDFDDDELGFEAGPTANYGAHIEYGAGPHVIRPRNGRALFWPGADHPVAKVNHPGNAPQPYMRPAFEQAVEPLPEILGQVGERSLHE